MKEYYKQKYNPNFPNNPQTYYMIDDTDKSYRISETNNVISIKTIKGKRLGRIKELLKKNINPFVSITEKEWNNILNKVTLKLKPSIKE